MSHSASEDTLKLWLYTSSTRPPSGSTDSMRATPLALMVMPSRTVTFFEVDTPFEPTPSNTSGVLSGHPRMTATSPHSTVTVAL